MYSVILSTVIGLGVQSADCCWPRAAYAGYGSCATCAPPMPIQLGCGCCTPCPSCGGMPIVAPPMMGEMPMPPLSGGVIVPPAPGGTFLPPADTGVPPLNPPPALGEERSNPNQVLFVVTLPADARLVAEGTLIPGSGPVRMFVSPPLEPGKDYVYDLVIEVDRNGKVLRDSQTVRFQAGKTANVRFTEPKAESPPPPPAGTTVPKVTRIRVRMPDGAALYVEGQPWAGPVVQTPPLEPGRTHYYQFRVETVQNGRRAVVTREVAFLAGQDLTVDFMAGRLVPANVAKNSR